RRCFQVHFRPFSQVMAVTHQGKLHIDPMKSPHGEPVETVIASHLTKDRLHFYGAFTEVELSRFRGLSLACLGVEFVQIAVNFDPSVAVGLMALTPHGAAFAALGSVIAHLGDISISALPRSLTYKLHPLSHGAYIEVLLLVVVQVLR